MIHTIAIAETFVLITDYCLKMSTDKNQEKRAALNKELGRAERKQEIGNMAILLNFSDLVYYNRWNEAVLVAAVERGG